MIDAHISTRDGLGRLADDARAARSGGQMVRYGGPAPGDHDVRWPAWKSAVFVVGFCGAFWAGVAYLAFRLFG